jgi:3-hydroxyacyl-CoA dehydrogenase
LESQLGLVEVSVGLIPAGGGCKEFALRGAEIAQTQMGHDAFPFLHQAFQTITKAYIAKNAIDAQAIGFAKNTDDVMFNAHELLYVAIKKARAMHEAGYHPPLPIKEVAVVGRAGIASLEMSLVNMREGGFISEHDYRVSRAVAVALCGGEIEQGSIVNEEWLLTVERQAFLALLHEPKTQQRIAYVLNTGKPLRN